MTYVVDAIMGAGKTSAAINYMNNHYKDRRFLYIVPYVDETDRIKASCPLLHFAQPSNHTKKGNFTKSGDLKELIEHRRNIAMSHELYCIAPQDTLELINKQHYTIIIDEVVDVFRKPKEHPGDIEVLVNAGYLVPDEKLSTDKFSFYKPSDKEYKGAVFKNVMKYVQTRRLVGCDGMALNNRYYCWMLSRTMFENAVDTYIMTYMFEGSPMYGFFKLQNLPYTKIGVAKTPDGYVFSDRYALPEMTRHLRDYIEILDHKKMNAIGKKHNALSYTWYGQQPHTPDKDGGDNDDDYVEADGSQVEEACGTVYKTDGVDTLRKNLNNLYKNIYDGTSKDRMWCTFKEYKRDIGVSGYHKACTPWNLKATNKYSDRTQLAFLVNIYINPSLKILMDSKGVPFSQEQYALSALIQWIWRSAIRNGEKVYLYLPSSRMRRLLNEWMDSLASGDEHERLAS